MIAPVTDNSILRQGEADSQSARLNRLAAGTAQRSFAGELEQACAPASRQARPRDEKLWNACVETESLFVARMLKEMRPPYTRARCFTAVRPRRFSKTCSMTSMHLKCQRMRIWVWPKCSMIN